MSDTKVDSSDSDKLIPKIYHQTYKTINLPEKEMNNSNITKNLYNDYKYLLWTDIMLDDFIKLYFTKYYELCNKFSKIQKIDFVRYCWMYYYGGVYSDLDILYIKKINFENYRGVLLIEREWTFPENKMITISVHNAWFASAPKHPFWLDIINEIIIKYKNGERNVFNLTGPNSISEIITRLKLTDKYDDINILPGEMIYQKDFSKQNEDKCFIKHLCYGSWK